MTHRVRLASSMQYQMRPPDVTSNCHCSISMPFTERLASRPWSGFWRVSRRRGSPVIRSHALRALLGAAEEISSQPFAASLLAKRQSQPSARGGGATRSWRLGKVLRRPDSAGRIRNRTAVRHLDWFREPTKQLRVGIHLGSGPPGIHEQCDGLKHPDRDCCQEFLSQFLRE